MVDETGTTDSADVIPPVMVPEAVAPSAEVAPEVPPVAETVVETPVAAPSLTFEQELDARVKVGAIIERTKAGWKVKLPHGGWLCLHGQGETLDAALKEAGA